MGTSGAGTIFKGWDAAYAYDDIGNRTESRFGGLGGSSDPVGSETITYSANELNQYEEIANPRAAYVTGTAAYSTTNPASHTEVVINGQTADRSGVNFVQKLVPSGTGPKWEPLNFELVRDSVTQSFQQHLYVPPVQETLTYDLDGNLTADARWIYTWDGENRLVGMTTQPVAETAGVPGLKLTFAYDGLSRRVQKKVEGRTTSSDPWVLRSDTRFVYDGWNMVGEAEYLATAEDAPPTFGGGTAGPYWRRTYVWSEDLSGSLQGAGGVGGLLLINRHERGSKPLRTSWATNDLNGNVIGLVESNLKAVYEYDPFGKPLRVSEPEEDLNPFRFSTKYTDAETGLCYYGYRYYDAVRGRWLNRDPIGEKGGGNLFAMLANRPDSTFDYLGLVDGLVLLHTLKVRAAAGALSSVAPSAVTAPGLTGVAMTTGGAIPMIGPLFLLGLTLSLSDWHAEAPEGVLVDSTLPEYFIQSLPNSSYYDLHDLHSDPERRRCSCPTLPRGAGLVIYGGIYNERGLAVSGLITAGWKMGKPISKKPSWWGFLPQNDVQQWEKGHLLSEAIGGRGGFENLAAQTLRTNRSSVKKEYEIKMQNWVNSGRTVCFRIAPLYVALEDLYPVSISFVVWTNNVADKPLIDFVNQEFK